MVEIHELFINNISCNWEKEFCLFEWTIGNKQFSKSISFKSSIWFERRFNGLLSEIDINKVKYLILITSEELSKLLPSWETDSLASQIYFYPGKLCKNYFIENEIIWNDFKVIFMRFSTDDRGSFVSQEIINNSKVFKKLYKIRQGSNDNDIVLACFRFPNDISRISEVTEVDVPINQKDNQIKVFIGQFFYYNIKVFIYITSILDLFKLFQDNDFVHNLSFNYNNKYLPLPSLPILRKDLSTKFETEGLYKEFIDRANIFCIYCSPKELSKLSIENDNQSHSQNELIKISDEDIFSLSIDSTINDEESPYDLLAYPAYALSYLENFWPYMSFPESFDYYDPVSMDSSGNPLEPEIALNEAETMGWTTWEDQLPDSLYEMEVPSINGIPTNLYDIEFVEKFSRNIHLVCLSNNYAVLEINLGDCFDRQYLPIFKDAFVNGLEVYNGVYRFIHGGALSFCILEKKYPYDYKSIIEKHLGYKRYRFIQTMHFDIYINLEVHKNYIKDGEPGN